MELTGQRHASVVGCAQAGGTLGNGKGGGNSSRRGTEVDESGKEAADKVARPQADYC